HTGGAVGTAGDHPAPIRAECDTVYGRSVLQERGEGLARARIPDARLGPVRRETASVRAEDGAGRHRQRMRWAWNRLPSLHIPEQDGDLLRRDARAARDGTLAIRAEGDAFLRAGDGRWAEFRHERSAGDLPSLLPVPHVDALRLAPGEQ